MGDRDIPQRPPLDTVVLAIVALAAAVSVWNLPAWKRHGVPHDGRVIARKLARIPKRRTEAAEALFEAFGRPTRVQEVPRGGRPRLVRMAERTLAGPRQEVRYAHARDVAARHRPRGRQANRATLCPVPVPVVEAGVGEVEVTLQWWVAKKAMEKDA